MVKTTRQLVLRGGTVVSVDPAIGTQPGADVLIRDGRIAAVGCGWRAAGGGGGRRVAA